MNTNFKPRAQAGFTLIELIVVIVILGILAATALPKFANLGGDARFAALNATKGAMASASAIVRGQILVNPSLVVTTTTPNTVVIENTKIDLTNGYPAASLTGILAAANIDAKDFKMVNNSAGVAGKEPAIPTGSIGLVPTGIVDTPTAVKCYITYTPAVAASGSGSTAVSAAAPVLSVTGSAADCL
jgi:MSHA pilin protein MshA